MNLFKKIIVLLVACCLSLASLLMSQPLAFAAHQMMPASLVEKFLDSKAGTWYDEDGNKVLTITGTAVNGCPVVGGYDFAGKLAVGHIVIREQDGERVLKLNTVGSGNKFLALDDKVVMQRSVHPMYSDSVMGIYLGISKKKTVQKLGAPDQTYPYWSGECFVYRKYGMNIEFLHNMAVRITLQRGYPWKLDNSGLSCEHPISSYQQVYHFNKTPYAGQSGGFAFGTDSEYMWFDKYPQELVLDVYNN